MPLSEGIFGMVSTLQCCLNARGGATLGEAFGVIVLAAVRGGRGGKLPREVLSHSLGGMHLDDRVPLHEPREDVDGQALFVLAAGDGDGHVALLVGALDG